MLAASAALVATSAGAADRRFTVTDFDRIQVEGPFQVTLTTGRPGSASASGSSQAIDRLSMDVQGRALRIRPNRSAWGGYPGEGAGPLRIQVTTHELRGASVSGSGSLTIDKARAMRFDIAVSGSGQIALAKVEADRLNVGLLGSGKILLGGKTKEFHATVQGTGTVEADGLAAEDAQINAATAGNISVGVRRSAKVTSTGQGDTTIIGSPACTVKALGSGRVLCGN